MRPNVRAALVFLFFGGFFTILLVAHSLQYLPFLDDDALISLRYAQRLLHGQGLTWTAGRPVEGYSNLLWVLAIASLGACGADLVDAARILGVAGVVAALIATLSWGLKLDRLKTVWAPLAVGLSFYCLAAPVAIRAIGGLEQPLVAALLAAAIPLCFLVAEREKAAIAAVALLSLLFGLLSITRVDGPIFAAAAGLVLIPRWLGVDRRDGLRKTALLLAFPILFYGGQIAFRVGYYGDVLPNTARVKLSPSAHHLTEGLEYVARGLLALAPFALTGILSLTAGLIVRETRVRAALLLSMLGCWASYLIVIGGDIALGWRHFMPIIVMFTYATIDGVRLAWLTLQRRPPIVRAAFVIFLALLLAVFVIQQPRVPEIALAKHELVVPRGKKLGLLLKTAFEAQRPLIAVTAAGCLPYWSQLPALDMLGLNDDYIARHPPENIGRGYLAHEFGDAKYILRQKPDMIIFGVGDFEPCFFVGRRLAGEPEFLAQYTPVRVLLNDVAASEATIWFRKYGENIGIRATPADIRIPGYFLSSGPDSKAVVNHDGRLVGWLSPGQSAAVALPQMPDRPWAVEMVGSPAGGIETEIKTVDEFAGRWASPGFEAVVNYGPTTVVKLTSTVGEPREIEEIVLRPAGPRK